MVDISIEMTNMLSISYLMGFFDKVKCNVTFDSNNGEFV